MTWSAHTVTRISPLQAGGRERITMPNAAQTRPVVVGIDGSRAAQAAALWAIDEAIDREVPLRLMYATGKPRRSSAPYDAHDIAIEYGETSLRAASSAVTATGKPVKTETDIRWDAASDALIAESEAASMLCVGSVGIGWLSRRVLGSTAVAVSKEARCPVAVVRYPVEDQPTELTRWIVVGVDERPGNDQLVAHALDEAHLRRAAVLAVSTWSNQFSGVSYDELDRRVETWRLDHPDLHIRPTATSGGLREFLVATRDEAIELVVMCAADADDLPQIIGPYHRQLLPSGKRSVMIVH
jgi:nucleotide-binding universal stress UspA family protein